PTGTSSTPDPDRPRAHRLPSPRPAPVAARVRAGPHEPAAPAEPGAGRSPQPRTPRSSGTARASPAPTSVENATNHEGTPCAAQISHPCADLSFLTRTPPVGCGRIDRHLHRGRPPFT